MLKADRIVPTTCPYCGVGCQVDLHVKDDLLYRVNGRFDSPVNRGNLCVKGRFGFDFVHAPDRLTAPLVWHDRGERGGPLQKVGRAGHSKTDWPEALDYVAARLRAIRDESGPDSIAFLVSAKCTNEENYLLQKLARAVVGTNHVDHCARL